MATEKKAAGSKEPVVLSPMQQVVVKIVKDEALVKDAFAEAGTKTLLIFVDRKRLKEGRYINTKRMPLQIDRNKCADEYSELWFEKQVSKN